MPHNVRKLLLDITIACQEIEKFTVGKKYEDFLENRKIIGFRNLLAHGYDVIDEASLWDFV